MGIQQALIRGRGGPPGQQLLTADSGTWVCPAGVTSVSVVCIGRGGFGVQFGGNSPAGAGGGLSFRNNIPVNPGQAYSFTSGFSSSTSIFGVTANAGTDGNNHSGNPTAGGTASGGDVNFTGGAGPVGFTTTAGGSAATYTANGATGGGARIGAQGIGSSPLYGSGGSKEFSGTPSAPGSGAINIIWGADRSFPNNASNV